MWPIYRIIHIILKGSILYARDTTMTQQVPFQVLLAAYLRPRGQNPYSCRDKVFLHIYRPQRSWDKVMFLHVSVILFTGGTCLSACWDTPLPGADPLGADTPSPRADPPGRNQEDPPKEDTSRKKPGRNQNDPPERDQETPPPR